MSAVLRSLAGSQTGDATAVWRTLLRSIGAARQRGFRNSQWVERVVLLLRGQRRRQMFGRPLAAWQERLESLGFAAGETRGMRQGTPFAHLLLVARVAGDPLHDDGIDNARSADAASFVFPAEHRTDPVAR